MNNKKSTEAKSLDLIDVEINRLLDKQASGSLDSYDIKSLETLMKVRQSILAMPISSMEGLIRNMTPEEIKPESVSDEELMRLLGSPTEPLQN